MPRWPEREPIGDPNDPRGFAVLIALYLDWMAVHHYSEVTVASARPLLDWFARWCVDRGVSRPAEVTRQLLERYQRWLFHYRRKGGQALSIRTQRQRLIRLQTFFRWLTQQRYLVYDPASVLELPRPSVRLPQDIFSQAEAEQILATPDVETPLGLRDRAMLETLYSTGVRRAELAGLDVYDVDIDRGWLTVRRGKGRKDRVVPIGERALAWVLSYIETARPELVTRAQEPALFLGSAGSRWSLKGLGRRVRQLIEASGIRPRRGSCHLFRHTMATLMLEGGADIRYIQEMLGHAGLETTQIYTKVAITKLKEIHSATHPAARLGRGEEADEEPESPGSPTVDLPSGLPS